MKYAMLFPGQGCQYIGMCNKLIKESSLVRYIFQEADDTLGYKLTSMIKNGNMKELTISENAQPSVVTASYALYRYFKEETGIVPEYAVGHSLGEISALIAAESFSFSEGIRYVRKRGELMTHALTENIGGAGIVVDLDIKVLEEFIKQVNMTYYVTISGYNSPRQFIVAGSRDGIRDLDDLVERAGGQLIPFKMIAMKADAPYHSKLMDYLMKEMESQLISIQFKVPKFKIWSTVTRDVIQEPKDIGGILAKQLITPIYWNQAVEKVGNSGVDCMIDMGPGEIMKNLILENRNLPVTYAFDQNGDFSILLNHINGNL